MRGSLYRKMMFGISMVCLIVLVFIAVKVGAFSGTNMCAALKIPISFLKGTYVSGTLCSIFAVLIIYHVQKRYSKKMLKRDFRCNEIIEELYTGGIQEYIKLKEQIPPHKKICLDEDDNGKKTYYLELYQFYVQHRASLKLITLSLSYENNDLLIESVQSCFFLNLNFKLLNIVNNIKNRLPTLRGSYPKLEEDCKEYDSTPSDIKLMNLGHQIHIYLTDLDFMCKYWQALLDYLDYDPTYITYLIEAYNSEHSVSDDIADSMDTFRQHVKEADRVAKRKMWKHKMQNFWKI